MTDYTTRDIVKNRMVGAGLAMSDNWDATIDGKCSEVTADIDRMIGQARGDTSFKFVADGAASTRTFRGKGVAYLPIADAIEITAVAVRSIPADPSTALASTDWIKEPPSGSPIVGIERVGDIFAGGCLVDVTAKWGYGTTVLVDVREAATIEVIRSYIGDKAGNDDRLGMTPFGSVITAKAFTSKLKQLVADYGYGGGFMRN